MLETAMRSKEGFDTVFKTENFKCAYITKCPQYAFGEVSEMKRHLKTDEVFVLLKGEAVMLIMEDGGFSETPLKEMCAYSVKAGTWHYLGVSDDALLFVTENADTDNTNSEVIKLENPYIL